MLELARHQPVPAARAAAAQLNARMFLMQHKRHRQIRCTQAAGTFYQHLHYRRSRPAAMLHWPDKCQSNALPKRPAYVEHRKSSLQHNQVEPGPIAAGQLDCTGCAETPRGSAALRVATTRTPGERSVQHSDPLAIVLKLAIKLHVSAAGAGFRNVNRAQHKCSRRRDNAHRSSVCGHVAASCSSRGAAQLPAASSGRRVAESAGL